MGLASGVTVAVLVIAFTQLGSGQFNPAITLGLLLGGKLKFTRALFIVLTQIFAAVLACLILSSFLGVNEKSNWIVKNPVDEATGQETSTMLEPVGTATPTIPERIGFKDPQMKAATNKTYISKRMLAELAERKKNPDAYKPKEVMVEVQPD